MKSSQDDQFSSSQASEFPTFHDGFLDGLCRQDKALYLFLREYSGQQSTILLKDVERANITNFRFGNIIFEVLLLDSDMLSIAHMNELYDLQLGDADKAQELLKAARAGGLWGLEINPSYEAECLFLFRALQILPGHTLPQRVAPV